MPVTNLHLAKTLDGKALAFDDIKLGMLVDFRAPTGGVLEHRCTAVNEERAIFCSTDPEWPSQWTVRADEDDLSPDEFDQLSEALRVFNHIGLPSQMPSDEQRSLVQRARRLGYAVVQSYTQASWTERGIAAYRNHREASLEA